MKHLMRGKISCVSLIMAASQMPLGGAESTIPDDITSLGSCLEETPDYGGKLTDKLFDASITVFDFPLRIDWSACPTVNAETLVQGVLIHTKERRAGNYY